MSEREAGMHFEERTVTIRGQDYRMRELSSAEYDKLYKQAEQSDGDIDTQLLLRLMALKSVVEPPFSDTDLGSLPMKVARAILGEVNKLHFGDDEEASPKNA